MTMRVKQADPVFGVYFTYTDHSDNRTSFIKAIRAPDEVQVRLWVQRTCLADCKFWGKLEVEKRDDLMLYANLPHVYDDYTKEDLLREKIVISPGESKPEVVVRLSEQTWAQKFQTWPNKGSGTTKTSLNESFYDAAKGALI
jgi:hypothetical protein